MRRTHRTRPAATQARRIAPTLRALAVAAVSGMLLAGASSTAAHAATPVDPSITDGTAQQALNAARVRWQAAHVRDYHFTVGRVCFCAPAFRGPATIVVRNGVPLAPPASFAEVATVPKLHAIVQKAINDRVERLTVTYDARGVPQSIAIDPSLMIADEEITYDVTDFTVDHPRYLASGDVWLRLRWKGPRGNATRTLTCRDGVLTSSWPDPGVCTRLLATPVLAEPITIETRDLRITRDPKLFAVAGSIEGHALRFEWPGRGSGTKLARLRQWETALGPDAIATVRGS